MENEITERSGDLSRRGFLYGTVAVSISAVLIDYRNASQAVAAVDTSKSAHSRLLSVLDLETGFTVPTLIPTVVKINDQQALSESTVLGISWDSRIAHFSSTFCQALLNNGRMVVLPIHADRRNSSATMPMRNLANQNFQEALLLLPFVVNPPPLAFNGVIPSKLWLEGTAHSSTVEEIALVPDQKMPLSQQADLIELEVRVVRAEIKNDPGAKPVNFPAKIIVSNVGDTDMPGGVQVSILFATDFSDSLNIDGVDSGSDSQKNRFSERRKYQGKNAQLDIELIDPLPAQGRTVIHIEGNSNTLKLLSDNGFLVDIRPPTSSSRQLFVESNTVKFEGLKF